MVREALNAEALNALEPREAAAYFIARRSEGLTSSEQQLLSAWLARDEGHRRVFESADRAWHSVDESEDDEILAAMRAHALAARPRAFASFRPIAAAAAVLFAAAGALWLVSPWKPGVPEAPRDDAAPVAAIQYSSARGEVKNLSLPDGSSMTLDADSNATGRFAADGRNVQLQRGRALFEVAPEPARPFAVIAAGRSIVAVGTHFDVNLVTDGLTVTLVEGQLEIGSQNSAAAPVRLESGQQYVERRGQVTIRTLGAASENAIAWRNGLVNFDDETLAEAAVIMNRYSDDQIVINDPTVASLRVTGQFRAGDTQRFAATLTELHPLRSTTQTNQIELVRE